MAIINNTEGEKHQVTIYDDYVEKNPEKQKMILRKVFDMIEVDNFESSNYNHNVQK